MLYYLHSVAFSFPFHKHLLYGGIVHFVRKTEGTINLTIQECPPVTRQLYMVPFLAMDVLLAGEIILPFFFYCILEKVIIAYNNVRECRTHKE